MNSVVFRSNTKFFRALLIGFLALPAFAQNGTITGTVVDPSGGAVPNATVKALDESKGLLMREVQTGSEGRFELNPLPPGTYTVNVEAKGMKILERKGIVLDVNQILGLGALPLEIGSATQTVTVESQVPQVETATGNKSFVLNSRQVTEISLDGRDFQSLMRTLPGVVSNDMSDFRLAFNNTDSFNVNGMRGSANNVYLDGSINTDVGANDGQYTQLSLDAIGEFKLQTSNFGAEYGRNPGILIAANMKSGGQQFHGTAYEFVRNDAFDANSFFNNLQGKGKSKLRFNQFGGNLGGPLFIPWISTPHKQRLFFFFNYEGTRASRPNGNSFYDVPIPAALQQGNFQSYLRSGNIANTPFPIGTVFQPGTLQRDSAGNVTGGVPFPNNIVPPSMWSGNAQAFIKLLSAAYRTGYAPTPGVPNQVRVPFQDTYNFNKDQKALRVDYNISSKANAFFRWVDDAQSENQGFGIFSGNTFPVLPEYRAKPGASWSWNLINVISPTTTNEFIFTYNHLTQVVDINSNAAKSTYDRSSLGFAYQELFPSSNLRNRFPNLSADAFNISVFPPGWTSEAKTYAWTDNFTKIHGSHTFKAGVFVDLNTAGQQPAWTDATNINFNPSVNNLRDTNNGLANLLLGNYTSVTQSNGWFFGSFRFHQTEAYVQDTWKVSQRLTLDLGIRWAYLGPTYTTGKYLENYWDPALYNPAKAVSINTASGFTRGSIIPGSGDPYNGIVQEGNGIPSGFATHRYNNWEPRFGFAFDPTGNGRTALRGGFGIFHERIRQNVNSFDALGNPPLEYTPQLSSGSVDAISPALVSNGVLFPVNVNTINRDGFIPTTYSWSLGLQQQLPWQVALDASYIGNTVRHLQYQIPYEQLPLGTTVNTPILTNANNVTAAVVPYKGFSNITYTDFGANSNYNALQLRVSRRFAKNFMINADYTWSKAMDIIDNDTTQIAYKFDRQHQYAPAGFDRTHVFNLDYVYTLPRLDNHSAFTKYVLGGWEITGITRFWSGFPIDVTSNGSAGTLVGPNNQIRPDLTGIPIYPAQQTWQQWFNPAAFARPANGSLGSLGRNALRGPGINNWDISIFKNFYFTERFHLQLRLETFNTFNHTQFAGLGSNAINPPQLSAPNPGQQFTPDIAGTVGQITSTRDPRTVQLGGKFYF
jgi:hypothetical protein